eukprot:c906_g1_i1 orf=245-1582(-)
MGCGKSTLKHVEESAQCRKGGKPDDTQIPHSSAEVKYPAILPAKLTILVFGGPGSSKHSLCMRMAEEYNFMHVLTGTLLKEEVKMGTNVGNEIDHILKEGKLVPDEIVLKLLKDYLQSDPKKTFFLIENFPATVAQAISFEEQVCHPDMVIYVECPVQKMEERLMQHVGHADQAEVNTERIKHRIDKFQQECVPVITHYEKNHPGRMRRVKGVLEKDEVFLEVASILKEMYDLEAQSVMVHKMHDCSKTTNIFILGGPGSGKGTQCKRMVRDFGYTHVSTGDLLRNEVKSGTMIGKEVDHLMKEGRLVPMHITITLLENAIQSARCKHFLIDGFPRSVEQAYAYEEKIGRPALVINLICSLSTMEKRLVERGKSSNRIDDNIETIKKRFEAYQNESKPVVDYYRSRNDDTLLKEVSAEEDPDTVYKEVKEILLRTVESGTDHMRI